MMEKDRPLVLIADDDAMIRLLVREVAATNGFALAEVESGDEAVAAFVRLRPDIVLLDVMMPGLDGFSICNKIRELAYGDTTPLVMLTALDDVASVKKAYDAGATDFITKPINWTILGYRLHYILRSKRTLEKLRLSEGRLADAQRIAKIGSWEMDVRSGEMHWSHEVYQIFAMEFGSKVSHDCFMNAVHPLDKKVVVNTIQPALAKENSFLIDYRIINNNNEERFIHTEAQIKRDETGRPTFAVGFFQDVTERRRAEEKIRKLAYFDSLTGLPNRALFNEYFSNAMAVAAQKGKLLSLFFVDLDRFKQINDTFGHSLGDELLQQVASRLMNCMRKGDHISREIEHEHDAKVSRFAGDEFLVLLEDLQEYQNAEKVAQRIIDAIAAPYYIQGHEIFVTTSIGISLFPVDVKELEDREDMIRHADIAMYHAKKTGKNSYGFYSESLNTWAIEHFTLENQLRQVLLRDELFLCYQPILDVIRKRILGAEVLVRWQNPEFGLLMPDKFIALAEETGLITMIDEWVMLTACRQFEAWRKNELPAFRLAINISGYHFRKKTLVEMVDRVLHETGIDPRWLELELTESILMANDPEMIRMLQDLKGRGITLSLDDFGTGYSSLSYLKRFPLDVLKIDKSFVKDMLTDSDSESIVEAIIALCKTLKLETVAEGVEKPEQMEALLAMGCGRMQGYLFSRPLATSDFEAYLKGNANGQEIAGLLWAGGA